MTKQGPHSPPDGPLSAEQVARREFPPARKGYDRAEVRAFLESVAAALEAASERVVELERRLARAAAASGPAEGVEEVVLEAVSAEAWRDEVLADLDRRRRELNAEVVRLRAGRDRLRADLEAVVSDVVEHVRRLDGSLQAARTAADLEGQRSHSAAALSAEERRAELEAARLAGFVSVSSPPTEPGDTPGAGSVSVEEPAPDRRGADALFARLRAERTGDPVAGSDGAAHADA
ncbi:MAG: DivIVA domain-containing protein [bacterium]|nr:DivIVA domain-containing protein [bacterium]